MPPLRTLDEVRSFAIRIAEHSGRLKVAVPAANDDDVIGALKEAAIEGFIEAILIGPKSDIQSLTEQVDFPKDRYEIIHETDVKAAANLACKLAQNGTAQLIMKGNLPTGTLLKAVLTKEYGLRTGRILSHVAVLSIPRLPRLLGITDGGMLPAPDEITRPQVVENAVQVFHALGIQKPKVALLSATDDVVPGVPVTRDLAAFAKGAERGAIKNAIVDGPLAFDSAVWAPITGRLLFRSPVAGAADIVVVGSFEAGNIIVKALYLLADAGMAGVICGAKVPVALVSRSDTAQNKMYSLALATVVAAYADGRIGA
ncbi:MAG: phosphate acyltransferase [bacterium]|nr:phosphate acyltransferase [bacterium]